MKAYVSKIKRMNGKVVIVSVNFTLNNDNDNESSTTIVDLYLDKDNLNLDNQSISEIETMAIQKAKKFLQKIIAIN